MAPKLLKNLSRSQNVRGRASLLRDRPVQPLIRSRVTSLAVGLVQRLVPGVGIDAGRQPDETRCFQRLDQALDIGPTGSRSPENT